MIIRFCTARCEFRTASNKRLYCNKRSAFRPPDNSPFGQHLTRGILLCKKYFQTGSFCFAFPPFGGKSKAAAPVTDHSVRSEIDLVKDLITILVERLLHAERFLNINVVHSAVLKSHDTVAYALFEQLHRIVAHLRSLYSVAHSG